jgi:hypothetical protein
MSAWLSNKVGVRVFTKAPPKAHFGIPFLACMPAPAPHEMQADGPSAFKVMTALGYDEDDMKWDSESIQDELCSGA